MARHANDLALKNEMVNIGAQNFVLANRVVAILASNTAPIRRVIREGKDSGKLLDVSQHRELRTVASQRDAQVANAY